MRDALSAYLADPQPTEVSTSADSADSVHHLGEQLAILRARVEALEQVLTRRRQHIDTLSIPATGAPTRLPVGQFKLTPRQVASLRARHARGAPIKALMEEFELSKASVYRYLK
jgi:hypothetical protein